MARNKLSIYLIKKDVVEVNDIFEDSIEELQKYSEDKCVYFVPSNIHSPKWLDTFFSLSNNKLKQANSKVVTLIKREYANELRLFAITFGYAKSLFKEDVLEEQFGLRVLLNSIDANELKKISKINIGGNQKQSQEQIPRSGKISEFGFDIDRDLVRSVTANTKEEMFSKGIITGGDILSVTVDRSIDDVEELLDLCYVKFLKNDYKERFDWVDNIREVRSVSTKSKLDKKLIELINDKQFDTVWMAVPEIIEWADIKGFKYDNSGEPYQDIYIEKIFLLFKNKQIASVDQLKSRKILAISSEDENRDVHKWTFYKCIICEFDLDENSYCLNNGKWYKIDNSFADRVNSEYSAITLSDISFIDFNPNGAPDYKEDEYNEDLANSINGAEIMHKVGEISYGGGQGNRIEVCDVITRDKCLIHIKKNAGSSQLSHLFNQATVSAEALLDPGFKDKWNQKLRDINLEDLIDENFITSNYTVVIAIINKFSDKRPKIPFFSKVSIRYMYKAIKNMGYKVALKNILIV